MSAAHWPELPAEWADTYATLHMWTQIVGKVALAQSPPLNHSWGVALQVTPRGLATRPLPHGARTFTLEFDFIDHQLAIVVSDSSRRTIPLTARSVSVFYSEVMTTLAEMNLPVRIWPMPSGGIARLRFITSAGATTQATLRRSGRRPDQ